ncbi:MAG: hypothetical protein LC637_00145 [Xanthomonadaceae bacterium]|nr:hypothetical protein [Xanthomonadaceae bacterium]
MMSFRRYGASLLLATASLPLPAQIQGDPDLPHYESVLGVSGNLSSIGSDTLNTLTTLWTGEFAKFCPNVKIQIQGAGSSADGYIPLPATLASRIGEQLGL